MKATLTIQMEGKTFLTAEISAANRDQLVRYCRMIIEDTDLNLPDSITFCGFEPDKNTEIAPAELQNLNEEVSER